MVVMLSFFFDEDYGVCIGDECVGIFDYGLVFWYCLDFDIYCN